MGLFDFTKHDKSNETFNNKDLTKQIVEKKKEIKKLKADIENTKLENENNYNDQMKKLQEKQEDFDAYVKIQKEHDEAVSDADDAFNEDITNLKNEYTQ